MTVYVFTGPTLGAADAHTELDAICLPPVAQGDVYRVARTRPRAIGIIDGYFERVPAVWHKEILWAMSEGVHVWGSASMGALRAAELAAFGMEGVGAIFEAYREGTLTDDDEVAVSHGTAESGYREISDAMVNIRPTLASAATDGVISVRTRARLERIAKELFYADRSYARVLARAAEERVPARELEAFRQWLPAGRVNQKRADALAMLRRMRERLEVDPGPKRVRFTFEHTDMWDEVMCQAGELQPAPAGGVETLLLERLLDELRLDGEAYVIARQGAIVRLLAGDEARRQGVMVTREQLEETTDRFRRERRLLDEAAVTAWLDEHHLSLEAFTRLMEDETRRRWVDAMTKAEAVSLIPDHLRATGQYTRWLERARDKDGVLETRGLQNPGLADVGLTEAELLRWYFEDRLGRPVPEDLAQYADSLGFATEDAFRRAVLCEFCYLAGRNEEGRTYGGGKPFRPTRGRITPRFG
jgi:hypothetical protein